MVRSSVVGRSGCCEVSCLRTTATQSTPKTAGVAEAGARTVRPRNPQSCGQQGTSPERIRGGTLVSVVVVVVVAGRANTAIPCCCIAVMAGGSVVEMATGVARGVVPPLVVITFTCREHRPQSVKPGESHTRERRSSPVGKG